MNAERRDNRLSYFAVYVLQSGAYAAACKWKVRRHSDQSPSSLKAIKLFSLMSSASGSPSDKSFPICWQSEKRASKSLRLRLGYRFTIAAKDSQMKFISRLPLWWVHIVVDPRRISKIALSFDFSLRAQFVLALVMHRNKRKRRTKLFDAWHSDNCWTFFLCVLALHTTRCGFEIQCMQMWSVIQLPSAVLRSKDYALAS